MAGLFGNGGAVKVVKRALDSKGWKYLQVDSATILTGVMTPAEHAYFITIRHEEDRKTMLFLFNPAKGLTQALESLTLGKLPFECVHADAGHSEEQVRAVCEALMHRNFTILLGNFERDHRDGEMRFRIAIPYRDSDLTIQQIQWAIDIGTSTAERVFPRVLSYLKGELCFEELCELGLMA